MTCKVAAIPHTWSHLPLSSIRGDQSIILVEPTTTVGAAAAALALSMGYSPQLASKQTLEKNGKLLDPNLNCGSCPQLFDVSDGSYVHVRGWPEVAPDAQTSSPV